ncbi:MAG: hypothetical protein L0Y56_11850, partial [Nitrospira sp.]|nr:hypothetical protein [Nitrospira sp.]
SLTALASDPDWGSPILSYDISVTRTGDGMDTEYQLTPKPKKKMDEAVLELIKNTPVRLEALFDGEDPFDTNSPEAVAASVPF